MQAQLPRPVQEALDQGNSSSYANDLTRSLSLVLDTFYENLNWVAVSSRTGEGFDKVFCCSLLESLFGCGAAIQVLETIAKCKEEYATVYRPFCEQMEKERAELGAKFAAEQLAGLEIKETNGEGTANGGGGRGGSSPGREGNEGGK
jgi:hypothetical protein